MAVTSQDYRSLADAMGPGGIAAAARILPGVGAVADNADGSTALTNATVTELGGSGPYKQSVVTFANQLMTITQDGISAAYGGLSVYTFPLGNILIYGCTVSLTALGDSTAFSTTFGSKFAVGTVTAAADITLTSTEANIVASVTNSAAVARLATFKGINTAAIAPFDGNSSAVQVFLNSVPTYANVSTSGTYTLNGTMRFSWVNLGVR